MQSVARSWERMQWSPHNGFKVGAGETNKDMRERLNPVGGNYERGKKTRTLTYPALKAPGEVSDQNCRDLLQITEIHTVSGVIWSLLAGGLLIWLSRGELGASVR